MTTSPLDGLAERNPPFDEKHAVVARIGRWRNTLRYCALGARGASGRVSRTTHMPGAWLTARANRHDALQPLALSFFFFSRLPRRKLGKGNRVLILEGADFAKVLEFRSRRISLTGNCRIWLTGDRSGFRHGVGCTNRCRGRLLRLRRIWLNGDRGGVRRGVGRTNRCRRRRLRGRRLRGRQLYLCAIVP